MIWKNIYDIDYIHVIYVSKGHSRGDEVKNVNFRRLTNENCVDVNFIIIFVPLASNMEWIMIWIKMQNV